MKFSTFFTSSLRLLSVLGSILLLLSCLYATVWNTEIVFFDLQALVLPYLVIANLVLGFFLSLKPSRLLLLPLGSLIIWFLSLGPFLVFSAGGSKASSEDISVLSYNVLELEGNYRNPYPDIDSRIMDFVTGEDADIVCFQEFASTTLTRDRMKAYPYDFRYTYKGAKKYSPLAIFSKYPILSSGSLDFPDTSNNTIYADLLVDRDTLRVYNIHLQSLRFRAGSLKRENPVRLYNRLGNTMNIQKTQAEQILEHMEDSPYPFIICGDLNNTQYSKIYRSLKKNMRDTFLEQGNGLGRTLQFKFLPFRIDFILVDQEFEVTDHQNYDVELSDHYPVKASFRLPAR